MEGVIYRVVSPSGEPVVDRTPLSPRLDTLNGKTVAMLWNRVFRGDETLPMIGELLQERYPDLTIVPWEDFPVTSVPALHAARQRESLAALTEALLDKRINAAITGNAGWGTCAAAASRLAITAEKAGVPAVAVGSPSFLFLIRQLGQMEGIPDLKTAEYPGILSIETAEELRENLRSKTIDEIVGALTRG